MTAACYRCGAFPNHPNPTLDVLKLLQCNDCGTVACIKHRDGIVGGQCSKCGSSRSSVIAYKSSAKKGGKDEGVAAGGASGGGGSAAAPAVNADSVAIASSQLKGMQKQRQDAERAIQERAAFAATQARVAEMSAEEKEKAEKAEKAVQDLLGSKNLVMQGAAEDLVANINSKLPGGVSLSDLQKTIKGEENPDESGAINIIGVAEAANDKKGKKKSTLDEAKAMLAEALADEDIAEQMQKLMSSDAFNDGAEGSEFDENSKVANVNRQNAVAVEKIDDDKKKDDEKKQQEDVEKGSLGTKKSLNSMYHIKVLDSFSVKSNHRVHVEDVVNIKNDAEKYIKEFVSKEFDIEIERIDLTLKVNNFIPLDNIDHLLNLQPKELEKENISIITGILAQNINYDTVSYLDQFALILPQKNYIRGIYSSFAENDSYTFEEQKEMNLKLLDMGQEAEKVIYLGLGNNCSISLWKEIFDEYDLSEIDFVYTEVIKTQEEIDFIKENNIKILIRPDIDFAYYASIIENYKNICFGSAFEQSAGENTDFEGATSAVLGKILKNMYNIDKKLIEQLLNLL